MKTILIMLLLTPLLYGKNHPRKPENIIQRIDSLLEQNCCSASGIKNFKKYLKEKGLKYPIDAAIFRVFKRDAKMEIWAKNSNMKEMIKVVDIPICAMDFTPNTKFKQGDYKTPEGFYNGDLLYGSNNYWMWMKLNKKEIDKQGIVRDGSSFKICLDYPNNLDRWKSQVNGINTGGAICIHGNCVSAGCVSFKNRDFLPVFAFAKHHNRKKYGRLQYHIFPFDFSKVKNLRAEAKKYAKNSYFTEEQLYAFWLNLKEGYNFFNNHKNPIKWKTQKLVLRKGDISKNIKAIKTILLNQKIFSGRIDTIFDEELKNSIKKFQKKYNMKADGVIGIKTLHEIGYIYGFYKFDLLNKHHL